MAMRDIKCILGDPCPSPSPSPCPALSFSTPADEGFGLGLGLGHVHGRARARSRAYNRTARMKNFNLDAILEAMLKVSERVSDLNFSVGRPPQVEVDGV